MLSSERPARPRVLAIGGPTAAGKTAASLDIAERYGAVILSADAMQVYAGMDIGTAKATPTERRGVAHFGLDVVTPDQPFDAAAFVRLADRVMADHDRVVVVGGTGMWMQALVRGLVETPAVDPVLRRSLENDPDLWTRLQQVDPVLAARLHPSDRVRLVRGMEVWIQSGRRLSDLQADHAAAPDRRDVAGVWLDRADLDARIDARVLQMMDGGYLKEVRGLLDTYDRSLKPMQSLGYRHLADHLLDGVPLDETVRRTQRDSRGFARKQRTWLRKLGWPREEGDHRAAVASAAERIW